MAHRQSLSLSTDDQLQTINNDEYLMEMNLENRQFFTSSSCTTKKSLSSSSSSSNDIDSLTSTIHEEYQIRTLGTHNIKRLSILPIYPPLLPPPSSTTPSLLLCNVPSENIQ
jgi:hypothetical protein